MRITLLFIATFFVPFCVFAQCYSPTEIYAVNSSIGSNRATVSWNQVNNATSYTVRLIKDLNNIESSTTIEQTVTSTTAVFSQVLEPETTYYISVRTNCSTDVSSAWSNPSARFLKTGTANDLIENAVEIPIYNGVGSIESYITTTNFLGTTPTSSSLIGNGCDATADDKWFKFIATSEKLVSLISAAAISVTGKLALYTYENNVYTQLSCNYVGNEMKYEDLTIGNTYYLRLLSVNSIEAFEDTSVSFFLASIPTNTSCSNASVLTVASSASLENENTLSSYIIGAEEDNALGGGCSMGQNVFYKFVATSPNHQITLSENCQGLDVKLMLGTCGSPTFLKCANNSNEVVFTGLTPGVEYILAIGRGSNPCFDINFEINLTIAQAPENDFCADAINLAINYPGTPQNFFSPKLTLSTSNNFNTNCLPNGKDVWYKVTAEDTKIKFVITTSTVVLSNFQVQILSGSCGNLSTIHCANLTNSQIITLPATGVYFIRIISNAAIPPIDNLYLALEYVSACQTAQQLCTSSSIEPYIFQNVTDTPSTGQMACLFTTPNPVYYFLKIGTAGDLNVQILQNSAFDQNGTPVGNNMDVDFVAWGPFDSPESCGAIVSGGCSPSPCPSNTFNPNFYPFNNIIDCSYSASYMETLTINNAQEGQYYILLITNFNGSEGQIKLVQTNFGQAGAAQTECINRIQLVPYVDDNNNGVKDIEESTFNGGKFHIVKNNVLPGFDVQSSLGLYGLFPSEETDSYVITYEVLEEFSDYAFTPSTSQTVTASSGVQSLFFPVTFTQQVGNVAVTALQDAEARAGLSYTQKLIVTNYGTQPANTTLTFTKDPVTTLQNLDSGAQVTDTGFTYPINNLAVGSYKIVNFKVAVPNIPIVSLDQILNAQATVSVVNNETAVANNTASIGTRVIAAYDPNNKLEQRGGRINITEFDDSSYLVYTINFQNLGNASAIDVRIEDFLNDRLDPDSVEMIASSHYYYLTIENNKLVWEFPNIQLPAASTNENLSKGYVTFRVKLNSSEVANETIPNGAAIYFDTNPPIFTNVHETVFFEVLSIDEQIRNTLKIYPNPVTNEINIKNINANESLENISIYSTTGQLILDKNNATNTTTLDLSRISAGFYFIKVRMASGNTYTVKIVKQ